MPYRRGLDLSTYFHVFNRGVDRQDIFVDVSDRSFFERLLGDVVEATGVRIHAYSLMSNHFHLVVEAVGRQLSDAMGRLGRGYVTRYNPSVGRSGPLFDGRFNSIPITSPEMLMIEGRYVHRNPIDVVGKEALANYMFSSLPSYIGSAGTPPWLTTGALLEPFAGDGRALQRFVERDHPSDAQWSGSRPPVRPLSTQDLVDGVCRAAATGIESIIVNSPGRRNDPRTMVATLGVELRIAPPDDLAAAFGFGSGQAVRNAAASGRARLRRDPMFATLRQRTLASIRPDTDRRNLC
ncbi:MAG: transposase [Ilumatobacter sp.]|uniref:transposase n=1 Tax=Ilumatobacter sp. TaxID=1967498 RepID=UPI003298C423